MAEGGGWGDSPAPFEPTSKHLEPFGRLSVTSWRTGLGATPCSCAYAKSRSLTPIAKSVDIAELCLDSVFPVEERRMRSVS
jgi:hypothetical protein